jgi:hypothetical protein
MGNREWEGGEPFRRYRDAAVAGRSALPTLHLHLSLHLSTSTRPKPSLISTLPLHLKLGTLPIEFFRTEISFRSMLYNSCLNTTILRDIINKNFPH